MLPYTLVFVFIFFYLQLFLYQYFHPVPCFRCYPIFFDFLYIPFYIFFSCFQHVFCFLYSLFLFVSFLSTIICLYFICFFTPLNQYFFFMSVFKTCYFTVILPLSIYLFFCFSFNTLFKLSILLPFASHPLTFSFSSSSISPLYFSLIIFFPVLLSFIIIISLSNVSSAPLFFF